VIEITETLSVDAPVEDVFAYMNRPENQPEITPSLTRSETVEHLSNGGKRVAYTYTIVGVDLDGHIRAVEYDPEHRIRWELSGDLEGEIEWVFESQDGQTRVTYAARYDLPGRILETVLAPLVERYNERELRTTLENLRTRTRSDDA
jgi:uncharacterized membrane protein